MINLHGFGAVAVGVIVGAVFASARSCWASRGRSSWPSPRSADRRRWWRGLADHRPDRPTLGDGIVGAIIYDNILWLLVFAVVAALGIVWQLRMPAAEELDRTQWRYA